MNWSTVAVEFCTRLVVVVLGKGRNRKKKTRKLVRTILISNQYLCIQNAVIFEDIVQHLLIQILRLSLESDFDTPRCFRLQVDVRWVLIQSDPHRFEFRFQQCTLFFSLRRIQNHDNHITRFGSGDDLSTSALSLCSTLDDTGQIKDLNLGTAIFEHARNCGECSEGVCCNFGFGLCDLGQEGGLSDRREADQCYSSIAGLADIEACAL